MITWPAIHLINQRVIQLRSSLSVSYIQMYEKLIVIRQLNRFNVILHIFNIIKYIANKTHLTIEISCNLSNVSSWISIWITFKTIFYIINSFPESKWIDIRLIIYNAGTHY